MLLVLMFHRISELSDFIVFLKYIMDKYPLVVPGDYLIKNKISICLTFDDAYYDFYHNIYPIFVKFKLKAVLGVPVQYILEYTTIPSQQRLDLPYEETGNKKIFSRKASFCTWQELKEMYGSTLIKIASHSLSHVDLTKSNIDLLNEVVISKEIIRQKLSEEPDTFIYPYGKFNHRVHSIVTQHYKYAMRIGSALNRDWHNSKNIIYRIDGEKILRNRGFTTKSLVKYFLKYLSNRIRGR
ncbi:MAG: polysaccharide deacetylase family protein [Thermodesulfovibrionales bacterium]|nr:polysaccharide deacetylase family protein [Thermodesulfovibrionales bacterium]